MLLGQAAGDPQELGRRHHQPHVAHHRLHQHGGESVAMTGEGCLQARGVVVLKHQRVLRCAGGDAGRIGHAEGGRRRARRHEQAVGMAVIVAGKLDDQLAAGRPAGQPHGAHGRLGAGADHPHLFDARHRVDDLLGQTAFRLGRRAVAGAPREGLVDRRHHPRMPVAEDHRAPRTDVVEVAAAVDVGQVLAKAALEKDWLAAHCAKGAGGRVHATGNELLSTGKGGMAARFGCHWRAEFGVKVGGKVASRRFSVPATFYGFCSCSRAAATAAAAWGRSA